MAGPLLPTGHAAASNTVAIAAASDLAFCLEELNVQFRKLHTNAATQVTAGSSGNFFAQIQRGAPFDVFLSADVRYPEELVRAGMADGTTLASYATGRLVLWTVRTNLAVTGGLTVLTNHTVRRIAIANPDHAPYGRAAKAVLECAGLWSAVSCKIVLGDNIAQTAQFVEMGHADAGLVALSLVSAPKLKNTGQWWLVPESLHPPLDQAAVLTRHGRDNAMARAYLEFLRSTRAREVFERFGFRRPAKPD
jgi:molybdate transport system substrate-binding protein